MTIDEFFEQLKNEYLKLNDKQTAYIVKEIESISSDLLALVQKYADKNGNLPRQKNAQLNRELEQLLNPLHEKIASSIDASIDETTLWTMDKIINYFAITYSIALIADSNKKAIQKSVKRQIYAYTWSNGTNLKDIEYWHARSLLDELKMAVNLKSKDGYSAIAREVVKKLKENRWKTENIAKTDLVNTFRQTTIENAKKSEYVEAVRITEGVKRSPKCVALATADHYGLGQGVYIPDTEYPIDRPHPRCTSFLTYVMKPRKDVLFND